MPVVAAFSVTTPTKSVALSQPRGEFPVTVKNEGTEDDRVDLEVEPLGDPAAPGGLADRSWFRVDGKPLPVLRPIAAGASETFTVVVELGGGPGQGAGPERDSPPPAAAAATLPANGTYGFRPLVYSAVRSHSETLVRGPDMQLVLTLPVAQARPPWWRRYWWALLAALLVVLVVAAVVLLLTRHGGQPVPDLVGRTPAEASKLLADHKLKDGATTVQLQAAGVSGTVSAQDPAKGATRPAGTKVDRTVRLVVVGVPLAEAQARAAALGLTTSVRQQESDSPRGQVFATEPATGQRLAATVAVTLVVATPRTVVVPALAGSCLRAAVGSLGAGGLAPGTLSLSTAFTNVTFPGASWESAETPFGSGFSFAVRRSRVGDSSPPAGARVPPGSAVAMGLTPDGNCG